ncbi:MAG TPA: DsbA family protein [Thermohalobaculum sp.]|nr:DsbA family protein [Thermohalobaculum sp.]
MRQLFAPAALALVLMMPIPSPAQEQSRPSLSDMTEVEREAFRIEVRAYLLEHPEVLTEAIQVLKNRDALAEKSADLALISAHREQLLDGTNAWVAGNPDGDVTLVEFSDYRCSYCKRAHPELKELLLRDPNIRLVLREFPILGPDSVLAARVATAALDLDPAKFGAFNDALMSFDGDLTEIAVYKLAGLSGYEIDALKERAASAEVEARIADNYSLARSLGLEGTPSFVLGNQIIRGYLPVESMLAAVAEARAAMN